MRDIVHNIGVVQCLAPADTNATATGVTVDLLGCDSVAFLVNTGAQTAAGLFSLKLQDSNDGSLFLDVPEDRLQAPVSGNLAANSTVKVGYRGHRRYVRPVLTKASGTSIVVGILAIKGNVAERPVA